MRRNLKEKNGITLIALVITIIVMLILVAVTISMAINGGLFTHAGKATRDTENAKLQEKELSQGRVKIDGIWYDSIDDYMNERPSENQEDGPINEEDEGGTVNTLKNWTISTTFPEDWDTSKVTPMTDGTKTVPIPIGFSISDVEGEQDVETGLVIKDEHGNEFVWVPVTELPSQHSGHYWAEGDGVHYFEPSALFVTGKTLKKRGYYDYFDWTNDFDIADAYSEMLDCVWKYKGFYIGRYETTIDDNGNIGSVYNTPVLTAATEVAMKEGQSPISCTWLGLYYLQKTTNYVVGNGTTVQTAMICGLLWDKTMDYIITQKTAGKTTYDVDATTESWHGSSNGHTGVVNSAQANAEDIALNIYDLESNGWEWTQERYNDTTYMSRVLRRWFL